MSKYISPVQNIEDEFSYHFTWSIFWKLKFSPPIKYRDCLFRLCPPCRYSARRQFWRSVKPGQSRLVEAFVRKLSEAADVEREQNEAEKKKQHGQARLVKILNFNKKFEFVIKCFFYFSEPSKGSQVWTACPAFARQI